METLVAVAHHRSQYYSGSGNGGSPARYGSSPPGGFRDVNCRAFDAGMGLLPSPFKGYGSSYGSPVSNRGLLSPKPQPKCGGIGGKSPFGGKSGGKSNNEDVKQSKRFVKSSPIAINFKGGSGSKKERQFMESLSFSELWAGPAYSNSPPPSSLPMPKFEMKPKRTVSLELPSLVSDLDLPPMPKSAPASPTRDGILSSSGFFSDDDSATKTLRSILNLDIADD